MRYADRELNPAPQVGNLEYVGKRRCAPSF